MGIRLFGSTSLGTSEMLYGSTNGNQDPIPDKFKINDIIQEGTFVIAEIVYPNCTNYEGIKIVVFKDSTVEEIKSMDLIDPHFLRSNKVFARFEPTEAGKIAAVSLCVELDRRAINPLSA